MNQIITIAKNTYKELIRDKALYILIFFAMGLLGLSILLSQLSIHENLRLTTDFGFSGIFLAIVAMTLFVGSTLVYREIDKKTILFLMSYPLSRSQFIMGKFFGFAAMLSTLLLGLGIALASLLFMIAWEPTSAFLIAFYGIFLEILLLLSMTLLFGVIIRPILVVGSVVGLFLIGHGMNGFSEIVARGQNDFLKTLSQILKWTLPNLENMNWMNQVVYAEIVPSRTILFASVYTLGWVIFFLSLAVVLFRRRDFV
jgi:ABC-type transport system involved in multi-copper enzyme maturation permease subunit